VNSTKNDSVSQETDGMNIENDGWMQIDDAGKYVGQADWVCG
jgi:hypothetical protein